MKWYIKVKLITSLPPVSPLFSFLCTLPHLSPCSHNCIPCICMILEKWTQRQFWIGSLHDNASGVAEKHLNEMFTQGVPHVDRTAIEFCRNLKSSAFIHFSWLTAGLCHSLLPLGSLSGLPLSLLEALPLTGGTSRKGLGSDSGSTSYNLSDFGQVIHFSKAEIYYL